jgi:hypothetical protein
VVGFIVLVKADFVRKKEKRKKKLNHINVNNAGGQPATAMPRYYICSVCTLFV